MDNFWVDYEWLSPWRFGVMGHPVYKPEYWDKIQELDQWTNKYDPVMTCQPLGLPRHGTPRRIVQQVGGEDDRCRCGQQERFEGLVVPVERAAGRLRQPPADALDEPDRRPGEPHLGP